VGGIRKTDLRWERNERKKQVPTTAGKHSAPLKYASLRMTSSFALFSLVRALDRRYFQVRPVSVVVQVVPSAASTLPDCAVWKRMWMIACSGPFFCGRVTCFHVTPLSEE
jgi:hypothetical protein